jgi:hypothetical protein
VRLQQTAAVLTLTAASITSLSATFKVRVVCAVQKKAIF